MKKPQIITADTCGCMVKYEGIDQVYYVGEKVGNGYVYMDKQAFKDGVGICYIPSNSFMSIEERDSIIPPHMHKLFANHTLPSSTVALDDGFTHDDLFDLVQEWAEGHVQFDEWRGVMQVDFCEYVTTALFANLVTADPCDIIESWSVDEMIEEFLQTSFEDPRLTPQQAKELGC